MAIKSYMLGASRGREPRLGEFGRRGTSSTKGTLPNRAQRWTVPVIVLGGSDGTVTRMMFMHSIVSAAGQKSLSDVVREVSVQLENLLIMRVRQSLVRFQIQHWTLAQLVCGEGGLVLAHQ
jgi:hypothetical protein